ncbi:MAG: hypothetical protein Ct9H90mP4_05730 [Gammaproteobacteria bacterium]|nr:MAG: hypothetical protein Ct9H90mP4_05730 [Gammaproteobacteria bacterium]
MDGKVSESPWNERSKLIDGFEDSRYRELAERLIWTNSMETADDKTKINIKTLLSKELMKADLG